MVVKPRPSMKVTTASWRRGLGDCVEVQCHPGMAARGEGHPADHRRAEATRVEKLVHGAQFRGKVLGSIVSHAKAAGS